MTLQPGAKLGPYEIVAPIGAGGMGEVWKARDTRLGRVVAIKQVKEQHSERFKREGRSIAALNHPNICQLYDIGPDYLVMEFIEGEPVKGPLPVEQAVRLAIQIAGALEDAHRIGILHRDLKPGNIMVTPSGSAKLLDFGLAKLVAETNADTASTVEGTVMGTPAYMSPEQAQGKPVDARSDIFSFGAVLYEMLSGRRAFDGASTAQVISAVLRDEPKPMQTLPQLERIVTRCLTKQPGQRYQTMTELKAALEQIKEKPANQPPSIAVLPFANISGDKENEYFSDGLAEEIINVLAQIPGLKVTARTSAFAFRGKEQDIRKIAETLNVRTILEGSVRKSGNRIRVTAQLINAADGYHLWSQRYDREMAEVFAVQDEIAMAIAEALKVKLGDGPTATPFRYTPKLPAYEAYLKARYHWGKGKPESLAQCKECLEQAIALDPEFALAHCGYADFLWVAADGYLAANEAMPTVCEEARKALEMDPSLLEAHAMLGVVAAAYNYDWKEAERQFRLALAHDPVPPRVRQVYGFIYLLPLGRTKEAVEQIEQGLKPDPFDLLARTGLSISLLCAGRLAEAQAELHKVLEFEENHARACYVLALTYVRQEKWTEALHFAEKASASLIPYYSGALAGVLKRMGELNRAEEVIQRLMASAIYGAALGLCVFHFLCGEMDRAADWLKKAIEQRHPTAAITASMLFRSTSQWPALAKLMNLPEEAR